MNAITRSRGAHAWSRPNRTKRSALVRELATFRSSTELAELAAILDRHSDADAEPIRAAVNWTPAA